MIYLIDDKKLRQENYTWSAEKFKKYEKFITPIYTKDELDLIKSSIFSDKNNVLLFHDSFFDAPINKHFKDVDLIRQDIVDKSKEIKTVFFSGGIYNRIIKGDNFASLPVEWLYKNLFFFIEQYEKGNLNLEYLAYGRNYEYERISYLRNEIWEILFKMKDQELVPLSNDPQKGNKALRQLLSDLLSILGKTENFNSSNEGTLEVGYFKYKINNWIKENINGKLNPENN